LPLPARPRSRAAPPVSWADAARRRASFEQQDGSRQEEKQGNGRRIAAAEDVRTRASDSGRAAQHHPERDADPARAGPLLSFSRGDAEAAFRLSKYHHFVHQDGRVGGRRWLVRAAEGGHATAQYNLAAVLQLDGGTLAEAARWAAEARKNGDPDAGRLLQRIEALRAGASRQPGR
ncbi:MAG: hypothetical protein ACN6RL_05830, partial [Variovorax sp.]